MRPRVAAVIPARGGSKGMPRKNLRTFPPDHNETLVTRQVRVAKAAGLLEEVYVSSDHPNILNSAHLATAKLISRPADLARDDCAMLPVIQHAARHILGDMPALDAVMVLLPTYPRRTTADVARVYWEWSRDPGRPLVGLVPARSAPELLYRCEGERVVPVLPEGLTESGRRQDRRPAFEVCLFACVLPVSYLPKLSPNLLHPDQRGVVLDPGSALDIDTPADWQEAQEANNEQGNYGWAQAARGQAGNGGTV